MTLPKNRPPTHPGEMLIEEFLKPLGMSQTDLANRIKVSFPRVNELVKPLGMSQTDLANRMKRCPSLESTRFLSTKGSATRRRWTGTSRPTSSSNLLLNGKRGVTPDTALRLSQLFGTTPEFWLNGQRNWDLWHALKSPKAKEIRRIRLSVRSAWPANVIRSVNGRAGRVSIEAESASPSWLKRLSNGSAILLRG